VKNVKKEALHCMTFGVGVAWGLAEPQGVPVRGVSPVDPWGPHDQGDLLGSPMRALDPSDPHGL